MPSVTGPRHGDSDFLQAPNCASLPLWQEGGNRVLAFGSGAGQSETCDSHTTEVSKWTFSKTPFFLSSRKRKIRERIGDKSPVGFFVPATQLASSLRRLCYLICEFRKKERVGPLFFLRAQTFQLRFHAPLAGFLKSQCGERPKVHRP